MNLYSSVKVTTQRIKSGRGRRERSLCLAFDEDRIIHTQEYKRVFLYKFAELESQIRLTNQCQTLLFQSMKIIVLGRGRKAADVLKQSAIVKDR